MASTAELYFKKITAPECGYDYIATLPERQQQENEWLEFKAADKIKDKNVDENWSKALAGFANTAGGVLIWGIDAERDNEGIDRAKALALVPDVDALKQRLDDIFLSSVYPPVNGVEIQTFKKDGDKQGFVVCLIPEGMAKAYRAEKAEQQFYIRIRDKFIIPHASIIRAMFTPRSAPYLIPILQVITRKAAPMNPLTLNLYLRNEGTLTGENIGFTIQSSIIRKWKHHRPATVAHPMQREDKLTAMTGITINPEMSSDPLYTLSTDDVTSWQEGFEYIVHVSCKDAALTKWKRFVCYYDIIKEQYIEFEPVT